MKTSLLFAVIATGFLFAPGTLGKPTPQPLVYLKQSDSWRYWSVEIIIPGDPVSWARPRFSKGRAFTAKKQADAKTMIQWHLVKGWKKLPLKAPNGLSVRLDFVFKTSKKKEIGTWKTTRSDLDNLAKLVLDAGNGVLYEDDGQVAELLVRKRWDTEAKTIIEVRELDVIVK